MTTKSTSGFFYRAFTGLLALAVCALPSLAQMQNVGRSHPQKILGGWFEEWSIYYAGYNIANLQQNHVADHLTDLFYAFANVTASDTDPTTDTCSYADTWADYSTPYLPSVSGAPYTGPLYGNFAAIQQLKQLHPKLKVLRPSAAHPQPTQRLSLLQPAQQRAARPLLLPASTCLSRATSRRELRLQDYLTASTSTGSFQRPPIKETSLPCLRSSAAS